MALTSRTSYKFKIGDEIVCVWNDKGSGNWVGYEGRITNICHGDHYPYRVSFCDYSFCAEELELNPRYTSSPMYYMGMDPGQAYGPCLNTFTVADPRINENFSIEKVKIVMDRVFEKEKGSAEKPKGMSPSRRVYWNRVKNRSK